MSSTNCSTTKTVSTEIVAIYLFNRAHDAGITVTRQWISDQLEALRSHSPGCRCAAPCDAAWEVTDGGVFWTANRWQTSSPARMAWRSADTDSRSARSL